MNSNLRTGLLGLLGAVAGFGLQGCFTPQPQPECSVTVTSAGLGLVPYYTQLKKIDSTGGGTCGNLTHMYVGMQRYRTKASGGDFTVAIKPSFLADPYLGYTYSADYDEYNNCVNEESCHGEDDPALSCVINVTDGGVELFDGTPVDTSPGDGTGLVLDTDGGILIEGIDLANECMSVEEPLERRDPADPDGKNLNIIGNMPQFPTAGRCSVTPTTGGTQNYQAETTLTGTVPAITYKVEFSELGVINNAEIPGIAFTGKVKVTEGACVANYNAVGFWSGYNTGTPEIHCTPDAGAPAGSLSYASECDPNDDIDAGRLLGSGMSPAFKPLCDVDNGICVPSIDLTTVK